MAQNSLIYLKQKDIGLFGAVLLLSGKKIYCFKELYTVRVKMPKI